VTRGSLMLDVAVPMYAAGTPHAYQPACQWTMTEIAAGRLSAAIDTETIQEVLHRYGALGRFAAAVQIATDLLSIVSQVLSVNSADAQLAIQPFQQYAAQGVPARDLVHAAVMQNNGLTEIVSPDKHFDLIAGITRVDPLTLYAARPGP
jgi:predicted nucleic acid-binding protein